MPTAFVLLNVDLGGEDDVMKELRKLPEVREAYRVYGVYDTIVRVEASTHEKLKDVVSWSIRRLPKVRSTLTMIAIE